MSELPDTAATRPSPDMGVLLIGIGLIAVAAVILWDASQMTMAPLYAKIGPKVAPNAIAGGLVLFGILTLLGAFRGWFPARDADDWAGAAWVAGGLSFTIAAVGLDIGFIPGMAVLFAFTARAMGRRALLVDLVIGVVIALAVYLLFTKLLSLSLPRGPLERLL